MEKWLVIVESDCKDKTRDSEFNNWYDTIHIPDVLSSPGFKGAARYVIRDQVKGKGKYLAIYEIETDDIKKTSEELREKGVELLYNEPQVFVAGLMMAMRDPSGNVLELLQFNKE